MTTKLISRVQWPITLGTPWKKHIHLTTARADAFHSAVHVEWATTRGRYSIHGASCSAVCARDSPRWALGHLSLVCTTEAQLPYQAHCKKKGGFSFSLSFHLFLNVPRLAQQLGSPWLQGVCCQKCPALQPLKPRQPLLSPRAGRSKRMWPLEKDTKSGDVSVSEAMKYLIPALSGICIITDLLICCSVTAAADRDDDSWHTLTQLHSTSYHSRAEIHHYYLHTEDVSQCQLPNTGGTCTGKSTLPGSLGGEGASAGPSALAAPAGAAAVALVPEQPSTKGTHRVSCAHAADLSIPWWGKMGGKYGQILLV